MKKIPMEHPIVSRAVQGHESALAFMRSIAMVLHTWDDLVDRDVAVSDEDITRCFWVALVDLPRNAFYREHEADLQPIVITAVINWRTATDIERDVMADDAERVTAFIIRSAYVDLLTISATIIGGLEWAVSHAREIHRWAHGEGFAGYLANLAAERAAREGK